MKSKYSSNLMCVDGIYARHLKVCILSILADSRRNYLAANFLSIKKILIVITVKTS